MESRRILLTLVLVAAAGCRTARLTEPLEHENRHLEDQIYCLQDQLDELHAQLESCRRENAVLRKQLAGSPPTEELTAPPRAELGEPADGLPSRPPSSMPLEPAPPYQGPPTIAPPAPDRPEGFMPGRVSEPNAGETDSGPSPDAAQTDPTAGPAIARLSTPTPETDDYTVSFITLNPTLTGGHNRDRELGDDGLMVVLEPRNKEKQLIQVPGRVSIAVLDPALQGPQARIARWDFDEQEVADHFKSTTMGDGYHFALPWPSAPPIHPDLTLFVRLTTADGQQFVVDKPIRVKLGVPSDATPAVDSDVPLDAGAPADVPVEAVESNPGASAHAQNQWRATARQTSPDADAGPDLTPIRQARRPARRDNWTPMR